MIQELRQEYPLAVLLEIAQLPKSTFYYHRANWVTDVTQFRLFGQKLYLSPILDLCSGDIVSYTISESPSLQMVTTMLEQAFEKIPDKTNLILHSDQGWHYRHKQYRRMLAKKGIRQSMSRKGNCLDNSVMENFFGHLKSELLYLQEFESMEHFKQELIEYMDYYNMDNTKMGVLIRDARKEKGLTQKDVAEKLGITDRAVSKWERGICAPDIAYIEELADAASRPRCF